MSDKGRALDKGPSDAPHADAQSTLQTSARSTGGVGDDYRNIFENASEGMYRSSLDGRQLRANPALVALNGYSSETEMLAAVNDIASEWYVDPARRDAFVRRLQRDGRVSGFESEIYRHKTRERIWISENAWLVRDEAGTPLCYEGTVQDITERRRLALFRSGLIAFMTETLERGLDESFYGRLLELATQVIPGAEAGSLLVADIAGCYRFVAAQGFDLSALREVTFAQDELIVGDSSQPLLTTAYQDYGASQKDAGSLAVLDRAGRLRELKVSLSIPVRLEDKLVALLNLNSFSSAEAFTGEAIGLAEVFAVQVGALLKRFDLERRLLELAEFRRGLVNFIDESLRRGLDSSFYGRLLTRAVEVVPGAEAGSLLLQGEDGRYRFAAAEGFDLSELAKVTFGKDELSYDFGELRPQLFFEFVENRHLDAARLRILEEHGRVRDIKVSLSIPVRLEDEVVAFFHLDNFRSPRAFDRGGVEMAEALAKHVAVIFKRLNLEAELRARSSALEASNRELELLASYDPLTRLFNRARFQRHLAYQVGQRQDRKLALLFLDLDGFKYVNDTLGHSAGDKLLQAVAERLLDSVRESDTVSRLGGDEFTVVLGDLAGAQDAALLAERVLAGLVQPFAVEGRELMVTASIGVAMFPDDAGDAETLLKYADTAMYGAKDAGKNTYRFFTEAMNARAGERLAVETALSGALARQEFELHYQPCLELASGRVVSAEALARWHHPELGLVMPGRFIPIAEESGLIYALGRALLRQACLQARRWQEAGRPLRVAVNLSVRQLEEANLVRTVRTTLQETALSPELLELELTESAVMRNVESSVVILGELRRMGVRVSVDDFGTAYSSLSQLKRLPLDSLKIDRGFIHDIGAGGAKHASDEAVVRAVVALAQGFGLKVVAEGVETRAQLDFLRALGCYAAQGTLFAPPLPAAALEAALVGAERPFLPRAWGEPWRP